MKSQEIQPVGCMVESPAQDSLA